jgi:toxin ParE1/3/4
VGRVIWAPSALDDADSIAQFIARDSVDRAALVVTRVMEASHHLVAFPQLGRVIPELNDANRREMFVGPYRLMYRIDGQDIWIVAIVHGARDWPQPPRP